METQTSKVLNRGLCNNPIPVKLAAIIAGTLNNDIEALGVWSTEEEATLSFKVGGVIDRAPTKPQTFS